MKKRKIHLIISLFTFIVLFTRSAADSHITQKPVYELESNYYNVKDYKAVGDGITDDTAAVKRAVEQALKKNGTVYFPAGTYIISSTVHIAKDDSKILLLKGEPGAVIVGAASLREDMIKTDMKYNFYISDLSFEHRGSLGSCINSLFIRVTNCSFTASVKNSSPLLAFYGSDCKISRCRFETKHPDSFAVYYAKAGNNISINDYIVDNTFLGTGLGILVGDKSIPNEGGRVEGLKINGNTFTNAGVSQIVIHEILHLDIAGNTMSGSSGSAIILRCHGYGPDGIYINNNQISAAFAGIKVDGEDFIDNVVKAPHITNTFISYNIFESGQYGFHSDVAINVFTIWENYFTGHSQAGVFSKNADRIIITSNTFDETKGYSLDVTLEAAAVTEGSNSTIINGNSLSEKNKVSLAGGDNIIQELP